MSAYVLTAVAGGSLGLLAGGILTQALSWHWIFFVNLPIGLITIALGWLLIPRDTGSGLGEHLDWFGGMLVTLSLMATVYAIVDATRYGWGSTQVLGFGAIAAALMTAFLITEARVSNPMMPLRILRLRGLVGGSAVRGLLVTGMYSTFFLGTLYLEHVLHYGAVQTGMAFLPWTITVGILSLGITARLVGRFGPMRVLVFGLAAVAAGLGLLTNADPGTNFFPVLFFGFIAIGLGIGSAFVPLMTIAMADVPAGDAGLGSGLTNLSQQVGGALGLAVLGTLATNRSKALVAHHTAPADALVGGYHLAFAIGAVCALGGIVLAMLVLRTPRRPSLEVEPGLAEAVSAAPAPVRRRISVRVSRLGRAELVKQSPTSSSPPEQVDAASFGRDHEFAARIRPAAGRGRTRRSAQRRGAGRARSGPNDRHHHARQPLR
jgi:MFS family permease